MGRALVASLEADGHAVVVVTRSPSAPGQVAWDGVAAAVDGADAVVNLAGVSIGGPRWTRKRKDLIRSSRVETTRTLRAAIEGARVRPRVFVTASGHRLRRRRGRRARRRGRAVRPLVPRRGLRGVGGGRRRGAGAARRGAHAARDRPGRAARYG